MPELRRFRLVLIDESHNLRNREGRRYRAIAEYIAANDSRVILLSATPYNKTYLDLSNQLRLFADDVVDAVNHLTLPRYGLGNYQQPTPHKPPTPDEAKVLADLSRAGTLKVSVASTCSMPTWPKTSAGMPRR